MQHITPQPTLIVTGAYGSGKTECALALALQWAKERPVTLVDLDFVTPYFRAQDHRGRLETAGVRVLAPDPKVAQGDAPSLPPGTQAALTQPASQTIVDLGGDPVGALVIAQFAAELTAYDLWAVVNFARPTTANPEQAAAYLREIAASTRLRLTGLVSNTYLGPTTSAADVADSLAQANALSELLSIPVVLACVPAGVSLPPLPVPVLPITPLLCCPWQS